MDADKARRLARAITSDISLYNEKALAASRASGEPNRVLADAIEEGRALFLSRASDQLTVFEEEIAGMLAGSSAPVAVVVDGSRAAPAAPEAPAAPPVATPPAELSSPGPQPLAPTGEETRSRSLLAGVVLVLVGLGIAAGVVLLLIG